MEVLYASTGFLLVRRQVYERMRIELKLPECVAEKRRKLVPYFSPLIKTDGDGSWYLADDFAFCERARQCGYRIMADTSLRILHIGNYDFGWEDAGRGPRRQPTYRFRLVDSTKKAVDESVSWRYGFTSQERTEVKMR